MEQQPRSARSANDPTNVTQAQRVVTATLGRKRPKGIWFLLGAIVLVALMVIVPVLVSGGHDPQMSSAKATDAQLSADAPLADAMTISGNVGAIPVLNLKHPLSPVDKVIKDELVKGTGRALVKGQGMLLNLATFSGQDGKNTTVGGRGVRLYSGLLDEKVGQTLLNNLEGVKEGSRLVLRAPVTNNGVTTEEITVVDVLPTVATGTPASADASAPKVTVGTDQVTVALSGVAEPTQSQIYSLLVGKGEQVRADSTVIARYSLINWKDSKVISSSWNPADAPGVIDMSNTLKGVAEHLVDVPVGSRVLLTLPSEQARGDGAVAMVIDVLAIDHSGSASATATATTNADDNVQVTVSPSALPSASPSKTANKRK